jgi:hypothetical protein
MRANFIPNTEEEHEICVVKVVHLYKWPNSSQSSEYIFASEEELMKHIVEEIA